MVKKRKKVKKGKKGNGRNKTKSNGDNKKTRPSKKDAFGGLYADKKDPVKLSEQDQKTEEQLLSLADDMWRKVKDLAKKQSFLDMSDDKKLNFFREKLNFKEFMTEFPVMCRYMVVMGQYSRRAFKRFLDKVRVDQKNTPAAEKRDKDFMRNRWIAQQASYVRYLWEAYQKGHWDRRDAQFIYQDAYDKLKGEFDDFKDKYKAIEENRKKEVVELKASMVKDLLTRLKSGDQSLSEEDTKRLLALLKERAEKKLSGEAEKERKEREEKDIKMKDEKGNPVITMIEHVDEDDYVKLPDKFKMTEEEKAKFDNIAQS